MKYDHLTMENLPFKPLYFSPGSERLEPALNDSDLIGTMSAFNCVCLGHYFSDRADIFYQNSSLFLEKKRKKNNMKFDLTTWTFLSRGRVNLSLLRCMLFKILSTPKPIRKAENIASRPEPMTFIGKQVVLILKYFFRV